MTIEKKRRKHEACHTIKENKLYKEKRICMLIAKYAHEYIYANYIRTLSIIVDTLKIINEAMEQNVGQLETTHSKNESSKDKNNVIDVW